MDESAGAPISSLITAYLALGSNLGDREANLRGALDLVAAIPGVRVTAVSDFLNNPAIGGPPNSPDFLNAAARLQTTLPPGELLDRLFDVEKALGRERREKWGPRTIDLDLLVYGSLRLDATDLTLPHPRLHEREFVLQPLAQIDPHLVIPGMNETVEELLRRLNTRG